MTNMLKRNIWRSITGSFGRYLAILLIIMLGSAFFTGLKMTRADMTGTASAYLEDTSLYDLRLVSTLGFDTDDVDAVSQCDGVTAAEGSYSSDVLWSEGSADQVLKVQSITDQINLPNLVAGRMPQAANECLLDAHRFSDDMIGQTVISPTTTTRTRWTCSPTGNIPWWASPTPPVFWMWTGAPLPWGTAPYMPLC